jgi:hypothetical protein
MLLHFACLSWLLQANFLQTWLLQANILQDHAMVAAYDDCHAWLLTG